MSKNKAFAPVAKEARASKNPYFKYLFQDRWYADMMHKIDSEWYYEIDNIM